MVSDWLEGAAVVVVVFVNWLLQLFIGPKVLTAGLVIKSLGPAVILFGLSPIALGWEADLKRVFAVFGVVFLFLASAIPFITV